MRTQRAPALKSPILHWQHVLFYAQKCKKTFSRLNAHHRYQVNCRDAEVEYKCQVKIMYKPSSGLLIN